MEPLDEKLLMSMKLPLPFSSSSSSSSLSSTSIASMNKSFAAMNVDAICCTHTCLPFAQSYEYGVLFNNGSAGMPNLSSSHSGIITRIACKDEETPKGIQDLTLYSEERGNVVYSALAVNYNVKEFENQFLKAWPEGSAAYISYYERIKNGVGHWTKEQAARNTLMGRVGANNGRSVA
jgi:hypothetical protein